MFRFKTVESIQDIKSVYKNLYRAFFLQHRNLFFLMKIAAYYVFLLLIINIFIYKSDYLLLDTCRFCSFAKLSQNNIKYIENSQLDYRGANFDS